MSKYSAIATMKSAIMAYINSRIPKNINQAKVGIVQGNRAVFTDGKSKRLDPTTDVYYTNGSKVICVCPDGSNTAAVVGVGI